ncbi:hypothetical protein Tco_1071431, partial [Tanacetum coccineum]
KKARKFKKPASPLKKRTLVIVEEEKPEPAKKIGSSQKPSRKQSAGVQIRDTPGMSVSKKKAPTTTEKSKGLDLLSEAALPEEAQLKKVLKRSRRETTIHQEGGLSDGVGFQPEVPEEPKGKSVDTHEGTGMVIVVVRKFYQRDFQKCEVNLPSRSEKIETDTPYLETTSFKYCLVNFSNVSSSLIGKK